MLRDACPDHRPSQPQLVFLKRTFGVFTGRADWNIIHLSVTHTGYMVGAKLQATLPLPNLALRAKPESGDIVFEHFGIMKRAADSWALLSPYKVDGGECVGKRPLPLGKFCCYWKKQNPNSVRSGWISSASQSSHRALLYFIYLISWSSLIYIHPSALASDLYSRASTRLFQHGLSVIAFLVTKRLTWKWKVRCVFFYKKKVNFS